MLLSDVFLTFVAYIGPKSRTERPRKTKIGTGEAHVTRNSDTTFKVNRLKVKVIRPLYSARLRRLQQSAWETIAMLRLLGGARGAWAPTGGGEGLGILCRHAHSLLICS